MESLFHGPVHVIRTSYMCATERSAVGYRAVELARAGNNLVVVIHHGRDTIPHLLRGQFSSWPGGRMHYFPSRAGKYGRNVRLRYERG